MKTLHVLEQSAPIVAGYTARARAIMTSQAEIGIAPIALTGARQGPTSSRCEEIDGIRHYRTNPIAGAGSLRGLGVGEAIEMAALARRIAEVATSEAPEVIHAHSPILCGLPGFAASHWAHAASVYEIRALWEDAAVNLGHLTERSPKYRMIRSLETWLSRSVDALVVICEGLRRDLAGRGIPNDRIFTVPNGVDGHHFAPALRDRELTNRLGFRNKTVFAYIGTLSRFEGVARLLEALARLTRDDETARGLIVGHGEAEAELRRLHASLGLGRRVVFTGRITPADARRYYATADILCYPREPHRIAELTTPRRPLEAMSMGKAVLASNVGGMRELVTHGETGMLFRAGDTADLTRSMQSLLRNKQLCLELGNRARRHILACRDWSKLARRYLDVYAAAIDHRRAASRGALELTWRRGPVT